MNKSVKIFMSFIGVNDAGDLIGRKDGAILTALKNDQFDEVVLLWNDNVNANIEFGKVAKYLKKEILSRKLADKVNLVKLNIKDVTDHNEIYKQLKQFCDNLNKSPQFSYIAAISSGTPAMQVCWILLAESGDFSETNHLQLIKVLDPKFGISKNIPVKIDTSLPQIVRLKSELVNLKKELIPVANISITKAQLKIGNEIIPLSPIELSYYKYFAERVINGKGSEKFSGFNTSNEFLKRIIEIHREIFPDLDSNRFEIENILKKGIGLSIYTFRGNISKLNNKIKSVIKNDLVADNFIIKAEGRRGAKFYGIKAPAEKFVIGK